MYHASNPKMKDPSQQKFVCSRPECGKAFSTSSHLSRHKMSHLDIFRYKCPTCDKAFKRSDILNRHIQRLHNLDPSSARKVSKLHPEQLKQPKSIKDTISIANLISEEAPILQQDVQNGDIKPRFEPDATFDNVESTNKNITDHQNHVPAMSPLSKSDVYSWISGVSRVEGDTALVSSIFDQNDMGWLFNEMEQGLPEHQLPQMSPETPGRPHLRPVFDRNNQFHPSTELFSALVDSRIQTPADIPELQAHYNPTEASDVTKTKEDDDWKHIERRIKEVLFDQYEGSMSASPKLTLSNAYAEQLAENKFFEAQTLKRMYYLYFEVFHDHFPILHKPTCLISPVKVAPLLMVSIVTLGAFHDTDENYATAVELHERLRWLIFSSQDLFPAKLWAIQTLALVEAFEKMASTRHQHEVSATFHSAVITLLRRDGSCANMRVVRSSSVDIDDPPTPQQDWELWIEKESVKRCVLFIFMMDAQHSLLFGHTSFMSATEIRLDLPCNEELWNASSVVEWARKFAELNAQIPNLDCSFVETLRSLLSEKLLPLHLTPFAKLCIMHGLLSVIWHVQQSDPGSLGVNNPSKSIQSRREILEKAVDTWYFSIMSRTSSLATDVCRVMHRLAFITLYTPQTAVLDVLTFCGSSSLIGRPLRASDFAKAKESVEKWVNSDDAQQGFVHSLLMIHQIIFAGDASTKYKAHTDKIALRPWCLYIATLVAWVYGFFKMNGNSRRLTLPKAQVMDEQTCFLKAEQFVLVSLRPSVRSRQDSYMEAENYFNNSVYLLAVVRSSLKNCRWEMMNDAYICLGKLIGLEGDDIFT